MAKKQRGKANCSLRRGNNEPVVEGFKLELESSDDEAPEEVTFEDSKAQALRSVRQALEAARREKELLKEKRRRRQELFQEQKKRKLLPAEVLEEIDSSQKRQQHKAEEEEKEVEEEVEDGDGRTNKQLAHIRNLKGNYTVTTGKERGLASSQQQAAEDFIKSRLYGPGSCRTTSNELLSLRNKTGSDKSAAVRFVKKDWAKKAKTKAEKLKKRWLHKQQIPS
ncbi:U3 small nucleolar RNA-associated protein NOL7 [Aulostomus maculatus]